jgi:hypothetical protein
MLMTRFLSMPLAAVALVAQVLLPRAAHAADFLVFPVKISLPVQSVIIGFDLDKVVKTTLKETDLVNLALGRPLKSKVDKKTEVLAVALTTEGPSSSPRAQLIVFNPSLTGAAAVTAVVATATALDFDAVPGGLGQGTVTGVVQQTSHGASVPNALNPSTLLATGAGTVGALVPPGDGTTVTLQGTVAGRLSFTNQSNPVSGFIVNGKAKVSGKVLGSFSQ